MNRGSLTGLRPKITSVEPKVRAERQSEVSVMSVETGSAALAEALVAGPVVVEAPGEMSVNCRATRHRY